MKTQKEPAIQAGWTEPRRGCDLILWSHWGERPWWFLDQEKARGLRVKAEQDNIGLERKAEASLCSVLGEPKQARNKELSFDFKQHHRIALSTFLMPWPFNSVHVLVTLNHNTHNVISLLCHNCKFATIVNHNINICYVTLRGRGPQVENHCLQGLSSKLGGSCSAPGETQ